MTDAEFDAYLRQTAPAILTARSDLGPAVALVTPVVPQLEGVKGDFKRVDDLPFAGLPLTTTPWLLLAAGVLLIGLGILALLKPSRASVVLLAVSGALLIAVPLTIGLIGKADAADHVDQVGKVALSQKAATTAQATTETVDNVVKQVGSGLVPDLARRLGETPAQVVADVGRNYPAVARGMAAWPKIAPGAFHLAKVQQASVPDYNKLDDLPFGALPWLVMIPGLVLLGVAGVALVRLR